MSSVPGSITGVTVEYIIFLRIPASAHPSDDLGSPPIRGSGQPQPVYTGLSNLALGIGGFSVFE